jgi:hypothetical protein
LESVRRDCAIASRTLLGVAMRTVNGWKHRDDWFAGAWRLARIEQAHCRADEIIDIADETIDKGDMAAVQRNRLRVDTRQWFCSKTAPRFYGDKLRVNVDGHAVGPYSASPHRPADSDPDRLTSPIIGNDQRLRQRKGLADVAVAIGHPTCRLRSPPAWR